MRWSQGGWYCFRLGASEYAGVDHLVGQLLVHEIRVAHDKWG